ncbi:hypothetical protein SDC9_203671 [bioreactor metagenome]|uniref:Carbon starvation protein A n=1 Tax=bioreactor metagenome TaxID=1076179 RepID=A0A645IXW1_9ZZZZ
MVALWASAAFLVQNNRNFWIAAVPAAFMSVVTSVYILVAPEGLRLPVAVAYPIGFAIAAVYCVLFARYAAKRRNREAAPIEAYGD